MAKYQTSLSKIDVIDLLPEPANSDAVMPAITPDQKIISWLFRMTARSNNAAQAAGQQAKSSRNIFDKSSAFLIERAQQPTDDWQTIATLSGHPFQDFLDAGAPLPLTAAEIDHFRRNHRETDRLVGRDFLSYHNELPSPVAELYGLYRHRARLDAEATLFVAQATGSTLIAEKMADILSVGSFASGHECVAHLSKTYSVPAAFDTSELIDRTCEEALRRLALSIESPAHLLKLSPDEISVLANHIVERHVLSSQAFLEKANLLAEARQDVHRLEACQRFATAYNEGDLPQNTPWGLRLKKAYARLFPAWFTKLD